jgi:hypothetical protein
VRFVLREQLGVRELQLVIEGGRQRRQPERIMQIVIRKAGDPGPQRGVLARVHRAHEWGAGLLGLLCGRSLLVGVNVHRGAAYNSATPPVEGEADFGP